MGKEMRIRSINQRMMQNPGKGREEDLSAKVAAQKNAEGGLLHVVVSNEYGTFFLSKEDCERILEETTPWMKLRFTLLTE